jgi:hypothetical protein
MRITTIAALVAVVVTSLDAQTNQGRPTFSVSVDLVQTDVIAWNQRSQFVADLKPREFEVFEDGVRQQITWLTLRHGGRVERSARAEIDPD